MMKSSIVLTLLISICAVNRVTGDVSWMTELYAEWKFECFNGTTLKTLQSAQVISQHDRQWSFYCGGVDSKVKNVACEWSAYTNDFGLPFNFQCPNDGIITGMASYSNGNDRRYQFLCCFPTGYVAHACQFTPNINALGGFMNYRRPDNWYIRGFSGAWGTSSSGYYDRVFGLNICKLDKLVPSKCPA
ncbi:unnamed protein product [Lymnaea stagnalis]|uniref:Uncharacterized protein n=1 Tax=Lymnaea stagnalis TaxID=6523 RepID=A0AAV2I822_LYMST